MHVVEFSLPPYFQIPSAYVYKVQNNFQRMSQIELPCFTNLMFQFGETDHEKTIGAPFNYDI